MFHYTFKLRAKSTLRLMSAWAQKPGKALSTPPQVDCLEGSFQTEPSCTCLSAHCCCCCCCCDVMCLSTSTVSLTGCFCRMPICKPIERQVGAFPRKSPRLVYVLFHQWEHTKSTDRLFIYKLTKITQTFPLPNIAFPEIPEAPLCPQHIISGNRLCWPLMVNLTWF